MRRGSRVGRAVRLEGTSSNRLFLWNPLLLLFLLALPAVVYAKQVTLTWKANSESYLGGYKVYYKTESSGNRVLKNYDGAGLTFVGEPYSGEPADSGFAIQLQDLSDPRVDPVTCTLGGLNDTDKYYFVVTAYAGSLESEASNEASTADGSTASSSSGGGGGGGCLIATAADGGDLHWYPLIVLIGILVVTLAAVGGRPSRSRAKSTDWENS
jgi:hypothetical protein